MDLVGSIMESMGKNPMMMDSTATISRTEETGPTQKYLEKCWIYFIHFHFVSHFVRHFVAHFVSHFVSHFIFTFHFHISFPFHVSFRFHISFQILFHISFNSNLVHFQHFFSYFPQSDDFIFLIKKKTIGICSILGLIRIQNRTRIRIHYPGSGSIIPEADPL